MPGPSRICGCRGGSDSLLQQKWRFSILLLLSWAVLSGAIPRRGNEPWSMLLCKFKDLAFYEPQPREWFENWFKGSEPDCIESYFARVSNGVYTIEGSSVHGWFTLPFTQKEIRRMAPPSPLTTATIAADSSFDYYDKIAELCVHTALKRGAMLHRRKITVINAGNTAVYGKKHGVLITPHLMFSSVLTHEMVHSMFIGHSYSDKPVKVFPFALSGEYDDRYDLMSTANAYMHRTKFGMNGPGLNGAHLDFLGWLPMERVIYFGRDGRQNYTLRLSSLSIPHSETRGWLLIMIPYDRDNPHNYYTVELRTPHSIDQGIVQPSILIHRVQRMGESTYSILLSQAKDYYELTENTEWVKFLESNTTGHFQLIRVAVRRVYSTDADVHITSTFDPSHCRVGERVVEYETTSDIGETKRAEEICVDGNSTGWTEADVRRSVNRKFFFKSQSTFGANSCMESLVWRALDAYDYVCVTPIRKDAANEEVSKQEERTSPDGSTTCLDPWLPRRAFAGDEICVSPLEKFKTLREGLQSPHLLKHHTFFNVRILKSRPGFRIFDLLPTT